MDIRYEETRELPPDQVLGLYQKLNWSSAKKPAQLMRALEGSHSVISAWAGQRLVGLGNALSDGVLVVYYPHLLVDPEYQGQGIGKGIMKRMQERYSSCHQQQVTADGEAVEFYRKCGFEFSGKCRAMWIYDGHDHD